VFFALERYRVVKITCSCSEVVLWTTKNYKAHYSFSWFRPLLQGNSPTSSIFVLKKKNNVTIGWAKSSRSSLRRREECSCVPCLKGRGPFIAGRWLDNYKLIISISSMGFTWLVGPDLRWLVCQGRLEASTVVLESSRLPLCSPGPPRQWGEWCPSQFMKSLLSEVFAWRWRLPSWRGVVDRLAKPCIGLRPIAAYRGDKAYLQDVVWSYHGDRRWCLLGGRKLPGALLSAGSFVLSGTSS
jgi:hypothetical protein